MIMSMPFVKYQLLGPFKRSDFRTPREAADHCQQVIATAANKKILPINVFQKFRIVQEYIDGHGTELMFSL
jgi:hypothetical protein